MRRVRRLTQILGITLIAILVWGYAIQDVGFLIPEEIEIVKAPIKQHPYQAEYEKLLYPTVRISSPSGVGSGVLIDVTKVTTVTGVTGCYIITAAHVVEDESTVTIEVFYPEHLEIEAKVVITDTAKDLALLKPFSDPVARAQLAPESYRPYVFSPIYTVGCSLGLTPRPSAGIISVVESDHWEVTSPILPGNSGGPVYDARTYEVIGIAVWVKVYDQQLVTTMAGIVPIQTVYEFLEKGSPAMLRDLTGCNDQRSNSH